MRTEYQVHFYVYHVSCLLQARVHLLRVQTHGSVPSPSRLWGNVLASDCHRTNLGFRTRGYRAKLEGRTKGTALTWGLALERTALNLEPALRVLH